LESGAKWLIPLLLSVKRLKNEKKAEIQGRSGTFVPENCRSDKASADSDMRGSGNSAACYIRFFFIPAEI
jgi:hypothetical protein